MNQFQVLLEQSHKIPVAVKNNGMYIAVAQNKATGNPVNKKETIKILRDG